MTIDLTKTTIETKTPSITHAEFVAAINSSEPIIGFIGAVEVPLATLDEQVPESFTGSTVVVGVDGDTVLNLTWCEFCNYRENDTSALLIIGKTDANGNRKDVVGDTELREWVSYFGVENVLTKSEMLAKINNEQVE